MGDRESSWQVQYVTNIWRVLERIEKQRGPGPLPMVQSLVAMTIQKEAGSGRLGVTPAL